MNCDETNELVHALTDGELELGKTLEVERHISTCTECAAIHRSLMAVRSAIRDGGLYFRAPAGLEQRVRSRSLPAAPPRRSFPRWTFALAATVLLVISLSAALLRTSSPGVEGVLASEVASAHIRSLMAEHLWDVKSTDRHTVKPWFDGRLDFAPEVRDFPADSFALQGGRLDYIGGRAVAALIYRHDKHYINLFIWPANTPNAGSHTVIRQGYVLVHWVQAGMNYWAVSDTSEEGLLRFESLLRSQVSAK